MCHNKSSPPPPPNHDPHVKLRTTSRSMMKMIKEEEEGGGGERLEEIKALVKKKKKASVRPKLSSSGKSRSKRKKTKYLSLSSPRLSAPNEATATAVESICAAVDVGEYGGEVPSMTAVAATRRGHGHQLNLFPLHPDVKDEESDDDDSDENDDVAMLFESDGRATLHGLLMSSGDTASTLSSDRGDQAGTEESISYTNYGYNHHRRRRHDADDEIFRTAMRGGGGDLSLEKWVCYSELVKEEIELTTTTTTTTTPTTSSASTCCSVDGDRSRHHHQDQRLALKLDYDEILNAWSDKGSFFIKTEDGESPPQLQDELFQQLNDSSGNIESLWCVPDEEGSLKKSMQRQASVLRYKQKRETRLFAKRIRYEVRKLNAEKRPRMKGRFVKSS